MAPNVRPARYFFQNILFWELKHSLHGFSGNTNRNSSVAYSILNGWPKGILWWKYDLLLTACIKKWKGSNWRELCLIRQRTVRCPKARKTNYVAGSENTQIASLNRSFRSDSSIPDQVKADVVSVKTEDLTGCDVWNAIAVMTTERFQTLMAYQQQMLFSSSSSCFCYNRQTHRH